MSEQFVDLLISTGWIGLALKATLALLITFLLLRVARHWPASRRHLLAAAAFGFLLLLPLAPFVTPARTIEVKTARPSRVQSKAAVSLPTTSATRTATAPEGPGARSAPLPYIYFAGVLFFS